MSRERYEFDENFQARILSAVLLDPQFLTNYRSCVNSDYFEYDELRTLCRLITSYFDKYAVVPDKTALQTVINTYCKESRPDDHQYKESLFGYLERLYSDSLEQLPYVKEKVIAFARQQSVKEAIFYASENIQNLDEMEEDIRKKLESAFQVGSATSEQITHFNTSWKDFPKRFRDQKYDRNIGPLPTGLKGIDSCMTGGGLGVGRMGFIEAISGTGKTLSLTNISTNALLQRKNVLFISNEVHPIELEHRHAARITGIPLDSVAERENEDKYYETMEKVFGSSMGLDNYLDIAYFKPYEMTVNSLKALISKIQNIRGKKVDLVVLDYFKRIAGINPENPWNSEAAKIGEISAVLSDFQTRMWSANQPNTLNREEFLDGSNTGGSKGKFHDSDVWITFNQSPSQAKQNVGYFYIAKNRQGTELQNAKVYVDKSRSLILDYDVYLQSVGNV